MRRGRWRLPAFLLPSRPCASAACACRQPAGWCSRRCSPPKARSTAEAIAAGLDGRLPQLGPRVGLSQPRHARGDRAGAALPRRPRRRPVRARRASATRGYAACERCGAHQPLDSDTVAQRRRGAARGVRLRAAASSTSRSSAAARQCRPCTFLTASWRPRSRPSAPCRRSAPSATGCGARAATSTSGASRCSASPPRSCSRPRCSTSRSRAAPAATSSVLRWRRSCSGHGSPAW